MELKQPVTRAGAVRTPTIIMDVEASGNVYLDLDPTKETVLWTLPIVALFILKNSELVILE